MKKIIIKTLFFVLVLVSVVTLSFKVLADDREEHGRRNDDKDSKNKIFNPDKQLSKNACGSNLGNPVINVVQKVRNDADSGEAGNYWAFDYYNRYIKVWLTAPATESVEATYCAIVTYDGNFYAVPGQIGPGNTPLGALIDSPIFGKMSGGRRAVIVGTLLSVSLWPTSGSVGTTNYQCNIAGTCPGYISWPTKYFTDVISNNDIWWGWKYLGGSHGTWINSIDGNSGNIL